MDDIYLLTLSYYKFLLIGIGAGVISLVVAVFFLEKRLWRRNLMKSQKFCRKCGGSGKTTDGASCELCTGTGIPPVCPICPPWTSGWNAPATCRT